MSRNVGFSTTFGIRNEVPSVCFCLFLMSSADRSSFPPCLEFYVQNCIRKLYREVSSEGKIPTVPTLEFSICTEH